MSKRVALYDAAGVKIAQAKAIETLTREQAQTLVNIEVTFALLGIEFVIGCSKCNQPFVADTTIDEWTVECGCTIWRYVGNDINAPMPPPPVNPREPLENGEKRAASISRLQMGEIKDFESVLFTVLKGGYRLYCLRCKMQGDPDGIFGARAGEENTWIAECACTRRTYRDTASATATVTH